METFRVATTGEHATGVLINDEQLATHHYIILIALKEFLRANTIVEVSDEWGVHSFIQILDTENALYLCNTSFKN